ncbi:MFS transporter [Arthrobacter sp. I2-34]|uniref:MFS transporter n=1 Tax=Arthrobacter hankyongi TaxID=2904801 RepID=A0ABS9L3U9_9MICC|nr:MFS transporter [Arthrobacter hankyongi]MCG2621317.1 MFS transporter [Arthrobacter hankyongi]
MSTARRAPALLVPALAFMATTLTIMQTLVIPVLPSIGKELRVPDSEAAWVVTANLMSATIFTPLVGRLADRYDKRLVVLVVTCLVVIGSAVAALVPMLGVLVAARVLQGLHYALYPVAVAIVREQVPEPRQGRAFGVLSAGLAAGGMLGLVVAGVLVPDGAGYQKIFWFGLALNLAAIPLCFVIPAQRKRSEVRVDWAGALVLAVASGLLLLGLSRSGEWGWHSTATWSCMAGSVLALYLWLLLESKVKFPLISVRVLASPAVLLLNVATVCTGFAIYLVYMTGIAFVQVPADSAGYGLGASVFDASMVYLLPGAVAGAVAALAGGALIDRFGGPAILLAAALIGLAGSGLLLLAHTEPWHLILSIAAANVAASLVFTAIPPVLNGHVDAATTGVANSLNAVTRNLGSAAATAVAASLLVPVQQGSNGFLVPLGAFEWSFVLATAATGFTLVLAAGLLVYSLLTARQAPSAPPDTADEKRPQPVRD